MAKNLGVRQSTVGVHATRCFDFAQHDNGLVRKFKPPNDKFKELSSGGCVMPYIGLSPSTPANLSPHSVTDSTVDNTKVVMARLGHFALRSAR